MPNRKLYNLKNFGIRGEELVVDIGANAKMNEFAAIMGLCNLKYVDRAIKTRQEKYYYYCSRIDNIKGLRRFQSREEIKPNYAYFSIVIEDGYKLNRDELYLRLRKQNIYSRKYFS